MHVECSFSSPLYRHEPDDFIRELHLRVVDYTEDGEQILLGRIAADLLPIADVVNAGEDLYEVCDADSAGWEEVYNILFEPRTVEFREELQIGASPDNVIFVWKSLLHPKLRPYHQGIFQTVGGLFGYATVVAIWSHALQLTEKELAELGFKKIANQDLIYRDMSMRAAYSDKHPDGTEIDLELELIKADEDWVSQHWDDDKRDHVDTGNRS